jgi:hypothetical protein
MRFLIHWPLGAIFLCCGVPLVSAADSDSPVNAAVGPGHWRLLAAPYSYHFAPSAEHKPVWAIGVERQRSDGWLAGASYFSNSFGQPSSYLYVGHQWQGLFGQPQLLAQASGGLMYGYRPPYEDKVPFNHNGFSPGALLSLGWQFNRQWAANVHLLGFAGLMFQVSYELR